LAGELGAVLSIPSIDILGLIRSSILPTEENEDFLCGRLDFVLMERGSDMWDLFFSECRPAAGDLPRDTREPEEFRLSLSENNSELLRV
jgi:hypothetical protein